MASIGPAEVDIGWFLGLHTLQVETAGADLPGFPDRGTMIAAYERRLGRELLPLRWFEAFALVRSASIKLRAARLLGDAGAEAVPALKGDRTTARLRRLLEEDRGQSIP